MQLSHKLGKKGHTGGIRNPKWNSDVSHRTQLGTQESSIGAIWPFKPRTHIQSYSFSTPLQNHAAGTLLSLETDIM